MNLQDKYPYDATILGLNGIYYTVGENSFFVNSPCILTEDQIITRGLNYLLCGSLIGFNVELNEVKLLDVYYDGAANLIVQDLSSGIKYTITQCLECGEVPCYWMLVDINFLLKKMKGEEHVSK
jgi:hypothetical protein